MSSLGLLHWLHNSYLHHTKAYILKSSKRPKSVGFSVLYVGFQCYQCSPILFMPFFVPNFHLLVYLGQDLRSVRGLRAVLGGHSAVIVLSHANELFEITSSISIHQMSPFLSRISEQKSTSSGNICSMSSPTIPTDVLSQILETAVDAEPSTLYAARSVNKEWLETADVTPKLWSTLNISRKIHLNDPEYVRLHLQNAGGIPLEVTITLHEDLPSYQNEIPAITLLREQVHRIKSLTLDMPSREAWQKFVTGIGEGQPAPILERFVLKAKEDDDDVDFHLPYTTLATAFTPSPNLTQLQIPAWPLPVQPPPHLSTVTSLSLLTNTYGIDISAVISLIRAAPHLQDLNFRVDGEYGEAADPHYTNIISVPNLRKAHVTHPGYGVNLLGNFRSPLLVDVRLDGFRENMPDSDYELDYWGDVAVEPSTRILNVLAVHSPNIRRFELSHVFLENPYDDYVRILSGQIFPVLEELILERTNLPDAALVKSAGLRRSLKKLELSRCKYISAGALRSFVQGGMGSDFLLIVKACPAIKKEEVESLSSIVQVEYRDA